MYLVLFHEFEQLLLELRDTSTGRATNGRNVLEARATTVIVVALLHHLEHFDLVGTLVEVGADENDRRRRLANVRQVAQHSHPVVDAWQVGIGDVEHHNVVRVLGEEELMRRIEHLLATEVPGAERDLLLL